MKTRGILVAMVLMGYSAAFSQAEYDDVYFSRKDRNKQQALEPKSLKTMDKTTEDFPVLAKANKKVEGYTGRTINPDYQSRYSTGTEVSSYFVPNYQPRVTNSGYSSAYANNGCYSCYNGWGMRNRIGFGMGMGMYSPYYSGMGYSPYGYGNYYGNMYDPYGYYGYNSWNSFGYGYPYSSWGYPSYYGSGWGMGYSYGYGGGMFGGWFSNNHYGGYASNPDNNATHTYGKRSSRNSGVVNDHTTARNGQVVSGGQQGSTRGGRVATSSGTSTGSRYYQRGWRQDPNVNPTAGNTGAGSRTRSSGWLNSGTGNSGSRSSSWGNSNSGWNNSNWNSGSGTFGGGSRSSTFGTGGGSRSTGTSFGGGSFGGGSRSGGGGGHSGGGSRGRN